MIAINYVMTLFWLMQPCVSYIPSWQHLYIVCLIVAGTVWRKKDNVDLSCSGTVLGSYMCIFCLLAMNMLLVLDAEDESVSGRWCEVDFIQSFQMTVPIALAVTKRNSCIWIEYTAGKPLRGCDFSPEEGIILFPSMWESLCPGILPQPWFHLRRKLFKCISRCS